MHTILHLCWDFDGTLYDTYGAMATALVAALRDLRLEATREEAYALLKRSVFHACETFARRFSLPTVRVLDAFRPHHDAATHFSSYPGAEACLRALRQAGHRHYLYTHRDLVAVRQLEADGLAPLFTDFITREDGFADKPAPDALLALAKKHGFAPCDGLMIGDRDIDVHAGKNAGLRTLLFDPDGFFPSLQADLRASSMADIASLLTGPLPR